VTSGLLGGAFDPPHNGHVALARAAILELRLDELVVVPTGKPQHKEVETPATVRLRLARLAFTGIPAVVVSDHEVASDEPSYTLDTVRWARTRWGEVVFVVGADEFADFLLWREPDAILEEARLAVATRPGFPRERLEPVLAALRRPERVSFFPIEPLPISSREIRRRVAEGRPVDGLVPEAVAVVMRDLGLYRGQPGIPGAPLESATTHEDADRH